MKKALQIGGRALFPALAILTATLEIFRETEMQDKMEDMIFFGLAVLALIIGLLTRGKMPKYIAFLFLALGVAIKIVGAFIEHDDREALDPDYAVLVFMTLGVLVNTGVQFFRNRRENRAYRV